MLEINQLAKRIQSLTEGKEAEMTKSLANLVNRESGSFDTEDVNALGDYLIGIAKEMGAKITRPKATVHGDPIACTFGCEDETQRRILLVCHRDTVFPHGTTTTRPFSEDATQCYGPGCADMKGGIVIGLYAISLLKELGELVPLEIIFTSDEEIGSEASSSFVRGRAKYAKAAFYLEPARANGALVTGRDGGDLLVLTAKGHSSHAGNAFEEGTSAIHGLAKVVAEMADLSDAKAGYSTNVGLISGGDGAIIVADHATAKVYTRFSTLEQREYLLTRFKEICAAHTAGDLTVSISEPVGFLPFLPNEANQALFSLVKKAGAAFGLSLTGMNVRGAADAGITSCEDVPTICGMGIVGGNLHTDREYAIKATLPERLRVLTLSILLAHNTYK